MRLTVPSESSGSSCAEDSMKNARAPKAPPPKLSDFKNLLRKLMQVPKSEVDEQEAQFQREKEAKRKKTRTG